MIISALIRRILKCCTFTAVLSISLSLPPLAADDQSVAEGRLSSSRAAVDAVLLVDASGSMLKTDSQMLRYEGAKLFFKFLGSEDRYAIISFSDKATVLSDLKQFTKDSGVDVIKQIQAIKTEGEYSDILEGIKAAEKILVASPRNDAERVIILLSDGKMEPSPAMGPAPARTTELVSQILPDLKSKEIKVHSLAFSDQADKELLSEISAATDGLNWHTRTSEDVHKSFADLFLAVKRPQVVPMRSRSFVLDDSVDEATFYISRDEGSKLTLASPKGEEMSVDKFPDWVTWFAGKNFDVITMKEPDIGEWKVQGGVATEGFATVLTNLKLVTDWPVIIRAEEQTVVQARLYEGDKPVSLPGMSGVVTYVFQIMPTDRIAPAVIKDYLNDSGRDGDKVAGDGIFSKTCTISESGEYKISVVARGPTFERTQQVPFRVRPRLISLEVVPREEEEEEETSEDRSRTEGGGEAVPSQGSAGSGGNNPRFIKGNQNYTMRASVSKEVLSLRDVDVHIEAISRDRKRTIIPLRRKLSEGLQYEALASALPKDGDYSLKAVLKGISKKNQEIEGESASIRFELTTKKSKVAVVASDVKKGASSEAKEEREDGGKSDLPIRSILLITFANFIALAVGLMLTKRSRPQPVSSIRYAPPSHMLESIANLEERIAASHIKVGDVNLELDPDQPATETAASVAGEIKASVQEAVGGSADATNTESNPAGSGEA